ncbi:LOW QUALITY PROTEIN: heparan-alpha-glucosaminide N-acetyltransferase-like [Ornithorhynchus anatinus]|uniref:LOW QUALITY PROTEIN: heparan-alpha-glucosaminide N-acetyltransferase-like n=1 Tax=Ornithorhynchus anatinus TaxID=9258 RepID=UPI0010A83F3B|nr:LOW QUALITY PROTEIN: heparan-alpha-glucosaminide N-acetyltransferase-like [Ornithorhynchus anatinus]
MERSLMTVFLLCAAGGSLQNPPGAGVDLKLDQALLTLHNHLPEEVHLQHVSDWCYKCLHQPLLSVKSGSSADPTDASVPVSTRSALTFTLFVGKTDVCRWRETYGEHGWYSVSVRPGTPGMNTSGVSCTHQIDRAPENSYIPLLIVSTVLIAAFLLYFLGTYVSKLRCTQNHRHLLHSKCFPGLFNHAIDSESDIEVSAEKPKKKRLLSLDTFRGLSLTLMVFVNYGGGGYWFFEHAPWNGLTVADLVMPWFVFILGTSVALAFYAMRRRGVNRVQLLRKLTWRTAVLMIIGLFFLNYGPLDGPLSWSWARIPGVLQRLAFTYFTVALMQTFFSVKDIQDERVGRWWAPLRDILLYWPEWLIVAGLEILWLCLTFLLPVPGCPRGYLGPGGIGDDGKYPNCTGGAAAYIDKWLLGENHIYHYPTCKELYKTTEPFDPEGVLGTINSVVMAFFGLQAGKIILAYRMKPLSILKRFLIWAILLGIISTVLTLGTENEGFIPINKNLWSLSFVTTLSCFSFILLGLMYYIIDVKSWWGGLPFIYPGMNSIFVYVGHSLLGSYFPFNWEMKSPASHMEPLAQDVLGTAIWVSVAFSLFRKNFFLKI